MPKLYSLKQGAKRDELEVKEVWSQDGNAPFAGGYKQMVTFASGAASYVVGFDDAGKGSAFKLLKKDPWFEPVQSKIDAGKSDIIESFALGMSPYLLAYEAEKGTLSFFPVTSDLTASTPPYQYRHARVPLTTGLTVCKPVIINKQLNVVTYDFKSGDVNTWALTVTPYPVPGAPPGTPALLILPMWIHTWAKSWSRFAFFYLGGATFFFKINFGTRLNVNIDHLLDDPRQGAVEVGTWLQDQLEDPTKIDIVQPFYMSAGEPYLVTYRKDGTTDWLRIHIDCQGWTKEAGGATVKDATQVLPYQLGDDHFALIY